MYRKKFKELLLEEQGNKGKKYWDYFSVSPIEWCCCFVCYAMREIADIYSFPIDFSCSSLKKKLAYLVNKDFKTAEIGDIILFENNGNPSDGPDHVGIVIDNDTELQTITLIEGNTGNKDKSLSTVNVYKYTYTYGKFDCIIDMSSFFSNVEKESAQSELKNLINSLEDLKRLSEELLTSAIIYLKGEDK